MPRVLRVLSDVWRAPVALDPLRAVPHAEHVNLITVPTLKLMFLFCFTHPITSDHGHALGVDRSCAVLVVRVNEGWRLFARASSGQQPCHMKVIHAPGDLQRRLSVLRCRGGVIKAVSARAPCVPIRLINKKPLF